MRRAHLLRPNKSTELPHQFICVDTETDARPLPDGGISHHLRFGWASFQRTLPTGSWSEPDWFRFERGEDFWQWVFLHCRKKTQLYVFAHNWSFDGPVTNLFEYLPDNGWTLGTAVIEGPPVILKWRRDNVTITILDSLNWWRTSLEAIGKSIGVPKMLMPDRGASAGDWDAYCRNDVDVLRRAMLHWFEFLRRYDLGGFAPTLASQALRSFRHRFNAYDVLCDANANALSLARMSLHGGRTEAFRIGRVDEPVQTLDINSMYPSVMRDCDFPTILRLYCRNVRLSELTKWVKDYCVVARVDLETKTPEYAHVNEDRLIFPIGRITTALTTPDLIAALEAGHIRKIHEACIYERAPLFREFVDVLYELRCQARERGDGVNTHMLKILMNSLYGKFAQRGDVWEQVDVAATSEVKTWIEVDAETGTLHKLRQFAGIIQERTGETEAMDSHPAIASHVTAYARRRLWDLMLVAGRSNVLYCDTDSLYVVSEGAKRLASHIDPARLGALKDEGTHEWMVIHGLKDYELPGKRVVKGVRRSARWTAPDEVVQERWSSLRGLLRSGSLQAPETHSVTKRLRRQYLKGKVRKDGTVQPFRLAEW